MGRRTVSMDIKIVKELVKEFKQAELTKLSLKCEHFELTLEKETQNGGSGQPIQQVSYQPTNIPTSIQNNQIVIEEVTKSNPAKTLVSPMVGTFYSASTPQSEPFVKVGSKVKKGDIICIIEAMKLMNEVEAEVDGEIVEVLVKNEQMVEYGQTLFIIQ